MIPALFTRISTRPVSFLQAFATVFDASGAERSVSTSKKVPPTASTFAAVSAQLLRAMPMTVAPASAKATQKPCPNPVFAPVITATFPFKRNKSKIISFFPFLFVFLLVITILLFRRKI